METLSHFSFDVCTARLCVQFASVESERGRYLQPQLVGVDTRQQRCPGRSTVGWGVGRVKANSIGVQFVDDGGVELAVPVAHVVVTQIIHQHEQDIGSA